MIEANILGAVIEKFVSPTINLSVEPIKDDNDNIKILSRLKNLIVLTSMLKF
jgi:hypothetical protein